MALPPRPSPFRAAPARSPLAIQPPQAAARAAQRQQAVAAKAARREQAVAAKTARREQAVAAKAARQQQAATAKAARQEKVAAARATRQAQVTAARTAKQEKAKAAREAKKARRAGPVEVAPPIPAVDPQVEVERKRQEWLQGAGFYTTPAWRYAGALSIPSAPAPAAAPTGSVFQQSLAIPTATPSETAASVTQTRRQLMMQQRAQQTGGSTMTVAGNYNRAFALPGTGG